MTTHPRRLIKPALLSGALAIGAIAATATTSAQQQEELRIGFLAPTTGIFAQIGKDMVDGFQMYLDEVKGDFGGVKVRLIVEDEQIACTQQRWQIRETQVVQARRRALQMQQAAPRSFDRGPLCNQIFRQVVGEIGAPHWARMVDYTGSSGNGGAGIEIGPRPSTRKPGAPGIVLMTGPW